jgi:hypothetical protein
MIVTITRSKCEVVMTSSRFRGLGEVHILSLMAWAEDE